MKFVIAAVVSALALTLGACAQNQGRGSPSSGSTEVERDSRNAALTGKVKTALAADVGLKTLTNIDVDSTGTTVTLKGKVDTDEQKRRAEQVARGVEGVSTVNNQLTVGR
ncbi:MAG TPA: BON domain-containing protein [Burkholderiales bacterium]|nr:BON domain-containing protein [Burkholderiales bacterium]